MKDAWLKVINDSQPKPGIFARNSRLKDANWIANTTRGTNDFIHCSHLIYLYDQNINPLIARWLGDSSKAFNDAYALTELIQWGLRFRVRKGELITLYLPSPRMRRLFEEWLHNPRSWRSQSDSNAQPSVSKTDALSNWAMGPWWWVTIINRQNIGLFVACFEIISNNNQPFSQLFWSREILIGTGALLGWSWNQFFLKTKTKNLCLAKTIIN